MKKFNIKFSLSSLRAKGGPRESNPHRTWKVIIAMAIVATLISGMGAIYLYQWVSITDTPTAMLRPTRDSVSPQEIRAVVNIYNTKQANFQELLTTRPIAPILGRKTAIEVGPSATSSTKVEAVPSISVQ